MTSAPEATGGLGHNNPPSDIEILQEKLRLNNAKALEYADKLVERADKIPAVLDAETAQSVTDYIAICTKTVKSLEAVREGEKAPFLAQGRVVDAYFGDVKDRINKAKAAANAKLTVHLQAVAAAEKKAREEAAALLRQQEADAAEAARLAAEANKPKEEAVATAKVEAVAQQAERMEKAAAAKPAQMARSRGATGATSGLRTEWKGTLTDRMALDLEALRQHLPEAALQSAITSYVKAGGRTLAGAEIKEVSEAVTR